MRFRKKYYIYDKAKRKPMIYGSWTPITREYQGIVEDYLRISRKRKDNKLAILKLQMHLLGDLIAHKHILDSYQKELEKRKNQDLSKKEIVEYINNEVFSNELIIKNLKDIADGIAWRLFDYDRALLYYLGNNPDIGPVRPSVGLKNEIEVWGDEFAYGQRTAILNTLTNFIRIGDITVFLDNGSVEFIEVKTSGNTRGQHRKIRLERQKEKLDEVIKFFNTGVTTLDGQTLNIKNMPIKPKNRFDLLEEVINKAVECGISHIVIEDYMIIECVDFRCNKSSDEIIKYFEANSKVIREKWKSKGDKISPLTFLSDRLDYSNNLAPISIWPLSEEICANLMMGGIMITFLANMSEVLRKFVAAGWEISYSIFDLKKEELAILNGKEIKTFITLRRGPFYIEVPPALIGRCIFELLSPDTLIESFEWSHKNTPVYQSGEYVLPNFDKENEVWN